jgi:hypothetical protein
MILEAIDDQVETSMTRFPGKIPASKFLFSLALTSVVVLAAWANFRSALAADPLQRTDLPPIPPAVSTKSGLLLEPPLDLGSLTREKFIEMSSTIGKDKIGKQWTSPVVTLPTHARSGQMGLTHDEVKAYMLEAKRLFDEGKSVPVSDVGLISTQEDIIRRPMLNHVAGFVNSDVRAYLLVQRTSTDKGWSYFSIVQDLSLDPPLDYFGEIKKEGVKFEATSCYKCHSSGPLAIHPTRADLVLDAKLAAALNQHIAGQPRSRFYIPDDAKQSDYGKPLELKFCARCHAEDGRRAPLFKNQSHPIRVLVDFGYMPPNRRLRAEEIAELKAWLEKK